VVITGRGLGGSGVASKTRGGGWEGLSSRAVGLGNAENWDQVKEEKVGSRGIPIFSSSVGSGRRV